MVRHQFPFTTWNATIVTHTIAASGALGLGTALLCMPKGTTPHRLLGRVWAGSMVVTSLTSFGIHDLRGKLSFIHISSAAVLYSVCAGVYYVRRGDVARHRWHMRSSFAFSVFATSIALLTPGRRLYNLAFGVPAGYYVLK